MRQMRLISFMIAFLLLNEGAADVVTKSFDDYIDPRTNYLKKYPEKESGEIHQKAEGAKVKESSLSPEIEDYLAPMTNYATKKELRDAHEEAVKVGQTKVQTKLNNIDVTVWTEPHSLDPQFCKTPTLKIADFIDLLTPQDLVEIIDHFKNELPPSVIPKILKYIPSDSFIPQQPGLTPHLYTKQEGKFIPYKVDPDSTPAPGTRLYTKQEEKLIPFDPNSSPGPLPPHLFTKQEEKFEPFDPNSPSPSTGPTGPTGPTPPRLYKKEDDKFIPFDPESPPPGPTPPRLYTKQEEKIIPFHPNSSPGPLPPNLFTKQEEKFIPLPFETNPPMPPNQNRLSTKEEKRFHPDHDPEINLLDLTPKQVIQNIKEHRDLCPPTDLAEECKDAIVVINTIEVETTKETLPTFDQAAVPDVVDLEKYPVLEDVIQNNPEFADAIQNNLDSTKVQKIKGGRARRG